VCIVLLLVCVREREREREKLIHTHAYICIHTHAYICIHTHAYIRTSSPWMVAGPDRISLTHTYAYLHTHAYAYLHTHTYAYIRTSESLNGCRSRQDKSHYSRYVYMYIEICIHVHKDVCLRSFVCMYTWISMFAGPNRISLTTPGMYTCM
jgi:hypothetical protein